jgi:hypothetical protein
MVGCIIDTHMSLVVEMMKCHKAFINKNVDIKFSAHDAFLEKPSSGTLKVERLEIYNICKLHAGEQ